MQKMQVKRTSITVTDDVRKCLKHIARKDQSYNELLAELIKLHRDHYSKNCSCSLAKNETLGQTAAVSTTLVEGTP